MASSPVRDRLTAPWRGSGLALALALLALALRLIFVLVLDPSPDFSGGDANWYMSNGRDLVTTGKTAGPLPTPPLYLIFVGLVQVIVPGDPPAGAHYTTAEMQAVRAMQAVLGAALCLFAYSIARRLFTRRAGGLAAASLAISPALIVEAGNLISESLFLFFMLGGLALYLAAQRSPSPRALAVAGAVFGLATLTRAIFLLFPLVLVAHLLLARRNAAPNGGDSGSRRGVWQYAPTGRGSATFLRQDGIPEQDDTPAHRTRLWGPALALIASYLAVNATWTAYNWIVWDRLAIGGEGLLSFVYQGATAVASPRELDEQLDIQPGEESEERAAALREEISATIGGDPLGWAAHRVEELARAYLQPHNTVHFKGPSIRDAAKDWLRHDRSAGGLRDVLSTAGFGPKLLLYLFHYAGLGFGAAGMLAARRGWRALLPLYGAVAYFTGIHLVLLALPRYLFPLYPVFWIFAAAWLDRAWRRWRAGRLTAPSPASD